MQWKPPVGERGATGSNAAAARPTEHAPMFRKLALALLISIAAAAAHAQDKPGLFVNLASGDSWRGWMALHFAHMTLRQGHPVTVFLNLDAVKLAATGAVQEKRPSMMRTPIEILPDLVRDGAVVLVCGPCLVEFGLTLESLVPGLKLGAPGLTQSYLFAKDVRVLSW